MKIASIPPTVKNVSAYTCENLSDSLRMQLPFMNAWLRGRCCDIISESFAIRIANQFAFVPATNKIHVIGSQAHVDNKVTIRSGFSRCMKET